MTCGRRAATALAWLYAAAATLEISSAAPRGGTQVGPAACAIQFRRDLGLAQPIRLTAAAPSAAIPFRCETGRRPAAARRCTGSSSTRRISIRAARS